MKQFFVLGIAALLIVSVGLSAKPSVALVVPAEDEPQGFDLVGVYLVTSMQRVRAGKVTTIPISDTRYRIYSNGKELRLYQTDVSASHHSYTIYRADGISEQDASGNISIKPGLQARHITEHTVKQLSVTQEYLTITQFPPLSDTVVVTYAKRLAVGKTNR